MLIFRKQYISNFQFYDIFIFQLHRIKTRSFTDKEDNKKYITEIHGNNMNMLGKQQKDENYSNEDNTFGKNTDDKGPGDLPFQGEND